VKTGAARSRNDGVGIAVKPLLLTKVRGGRVDPDKCVLVVGYAVEQPLTTRCDMSPVLNVVRGPIALGPLRSPVC
jgi:hypothetical protein